MLCSSSVSPGSSTLVFSPSLARAAIFFCSALAGLASADFSSRRACLDALVRARDGEPQRRRLVGCQLDVPRQLPAGALAEGAVVARRRRRAVAGADDRRVLRAAVVCAELVDLARCGRRPEQPSRARDALATGGVPCLAEQQRILVEGAGVLQVEGAGVRRRPAPRVRRHQLGVRVHGQRHGAGRRGREGEADQGGAGAVGHEVGALHRDLVHRREAVLV